MNKNKKRETNYDEIYDFLEGWLAYAKKANTYLSRRKIIAWIENSFMNAMASKEINRMAKSITAL